MRALAGAGCVAADEEAVELVASAPDADSLEALVARRVAGEPLAWLTGTSRFCGTDVAVDPGVYVPRWQSETLAERAASLLPDRGTAVDLATGSGAIALVLSRRRPGARVVGTDVDPRAVACARRNGVTVLEGPLDDPLPDDLAGRVDVLCGVLPYVPTGALHLLPRDVLAYEPRRALDGGPDGLGPVGGRGGPQSPLGASGRLAAARGRGRPGRRPRRAVLVGRLRRPRGARRRGR